MWNGRQQEAQAAEAHHATLAVDAAVGEQKETNLKAMEESLAAENTQVMDHIRARELLRMEDSKHIGNFSTDVINGLVPNIQRGELTLFKAVPLARQDQDTLQTIP